MEFLILVIAVLLNICLFLAIDTEKYKKAINIILKVTLVFGVFVLFLSTFKIIELPSSTQLTLFKYDNGFLFFFAAVIGGSAMILPVTAWFAMLRIAFRIVLKIVDVIRKKQTNRHIWKSFWYTVLYGIMILGLYIVLFLYGILCGNQISFM